MKNNRTFLEKLLDGTEVEWKPLWSVTTWDKRFNAVEKEKQPKVIKYHYYLASELKPLIVDGGNVKLLTTNESDIWTTEELVQSNISEGEIIAIPWGGNPIVQYYKGKFVTADNRIATSNNTKILDNKFLYYFLLSKLDVISSFYRGSGIKHPSMYHVLEMLIPIPPLPVQTEIVRILDALTALTSELTSELILRRKQYKYYRENFLSVDNLKLSTENIQWVKLNDLGELIRGNGLQKKDFTETGVPAIHYGQIYTYYGTFATKTKSFVSPELAKKLKKVDCGDVVITNTSENFEDVGKAMVYLGTDQAVTGGHATIFKPNHEKILSKYFVYLTQTSFFTNEKRKYAKGTKVIDVSATDMAKIILPIPPLKEQQRIVSILDKFETLTNSITEGLPLAIEQSQKRYEYYRELLLNFS